MWANWSQNQISLDLLESSHTSQVAGAEYKSDIGI